MFTLPHHISLRIQKGTGTLVTSYNSTSEISTNKRQFLSLYQTWGLELRVLIELSFRKEFHVNSKKLGRNGTTLLHSEDLILTLSVSRQNIKSCYKIKVAANIKLKLSVKEIHVFQLKCRYSKLYLVSLKMRRLLHFFNQRKRTLMWNWHIIFQRS